MAHHTPLIATIVVGLTLAFVLGALAHRIKISPIAGYLLAGIAVGPHTPGFVADQTLALELAEIGVILLMFGVGLHFSVADLMSVRRIAIPGALAQIALATLLGMGLASFLGWPLGPSVVFGLALSVASTVVLLRALQERRLVGSERGRIAVGWLIVEDMAMVLALVLLPALTPLLKGSGQDASALIGIAGEAAWTIAKVAIFVAVMLVIGRRLIPSLLHYIAHTGSRELFRLGVLAIALGVAYGAAKLFGVSFALGAFFAGMVLAESELSQRAAEESLPLRDAFAVLFFVSVGMLFDPGIMIKQAGPVLATLLIIVIGKSLAALAIVLAFRYSLATALFIAASLAQIGEFSFILAGLGVDLGLLDATGRDLVLAGALLSILVNPLLFLALDRLEPALTGTKPAGTASPVHAPSKAGAAPTGTATATAGAREERGHVILVGYGRVGQRIAEQARKDGAGLVVIDERDDVAEAIRAKGFRAIAAGTRSALDEAGVAVAKALVVAIPDVFEAGQIIEQARAKNAHLVIIARGHSDAEVEHLTACGASSVVQGADEIARAMAGQLRLRTGYSKP